MYLYRLEVKMAINQKIFKLFLLYYYKTIVLAYENK